LLILFSISGCLSVGTPDKEQIINDNIGTVIKNQEILNNNLQVIVENQNRELENMKINQENIIANCRCQR